ncbi:MAG: hypothetical protein QXH30_01505 [Candidatus Bilamarchaeaceae archaeon]
MSKLTRTQFIKTEAGNNFAPPLKRVLVRFGDHYVLKRAKDLAEGDRVRWKREFIQKTLDEVDVVLSAQSERYAAAREVVMVQNSARVWIPKMRVHLLESISSASMAQILLEGTDISTEQYRGVSNRVHGRIVEYSSMHSLEPVCWDTVLNWVSGKVIAPAEKRFLDAMGIFNPVFSEIYLDFVNKGPWSEAYWIYTNLRKIAMSYISEIQLGEKNGNAKKGKNRGGLDFGPELSAVVGAFAEEMKGMFLDVEVLGNETVRLDKKKIARQRGVDPHLFRGLVKADEEHGEIKIDKLENYSDDAVFGIEDASALNDPEKLIEHAKGFAIGHGFSLEDLKERFSKKDVSIPIDILLDATEGIMPREAVENVIRSMGLGNKVNHVLLDIRDGRREIKALLEDGSVVPLMELDPLAVREMGNVAAEMVEKVGRLEELANQIASEGD